MKQYVVALDQGTTSSRAIVFDVQGRIVGSCSKEFRQIFPRPGWMEHDPMDILHSQIEVLREVVQKNDIDPEDIAAIGITNQRETTLVWEKRTGKPIYNAIVWQCRRTATFCEELKKSGWQASIREKTGLIIDPYFSGTKLKWILDHTEGAREAALRGELLFGTVDSWLLWNLTDGKVHATDYTNASRTMLYNIHRLEWDQDILEEMGIPKAMLPEVKPSSGILGYLHKGILGVEIPIASLIGDQQSALFGQTCFEPGDAKNTYGTGCFLLMATGTQPVESKNQLLTTIALGLDGEVQYALEGSIFMGGATIQWLRDELGLIQKASDSEAAALQAGEVEGVYVVPAFAGLGAPYWDMYARGTIVGLTRGTGRNHIIRAALESIAYQTRDVLEAMEDDSGIRLKGLKVDGGACANNFLMQFQSDLLNTKVYRPAIIETTALGAAYLAGLGVGMWGSKKDIAALVKMDRVFAPSMEEERREQKYKGWKRAVQRAMEWAE